MAYYLWINDLFHNPINPAVLDRGVITGDYMKRMVITVISGNGT